jgi:phenylacetate-CoA ligase
MAQTDQNPRIAGLLNQETRDTLRSVLSHCWENFRFYRRRFEASGVNLTDIETADPVTILQKLPLLESANLSDLSTEVAATADSVIDVETSSGTTGQRKVRYISYEDDQREHEFLAELWAIAGVGSADRVACLDTDPVNLMVSIAKAFDLLGVAEAYCLSAGANFAHTVRAIKKLAPTVLVSVPSIIERYLFQADWPQSNNERPSFSKVIYIGESMPAATRRALENAGVEVFGYYGASETSALGIECSAHQGIHVIQSRNIVELLPDVDDPTQSAAVITTLNQWAQPLLRYRLGDKVQEVPAPCPCGLPDPRLIVQGKPDESISILGSKIGYGSLKTSAYRHDSQSGPLQVVVSRTTIEVLDLVLPDTIKSNEKEVRKSVLSAEPDLAFLIDSGFTKLSITFVSPEHFVSDRKFKPIIDLRA